MKYTLRRRWRPILVVAFLIAAPTAITVTAVADARAAATCSVEYAVTNQWPGGFTADVRVTNLGVPIDGWTLAWTFPAGQTVTQAWNATADLGTSTVTATNLSYNAALGSGATVGFGLAGTRSATNPAPTSFTLNGVACNDSSTTTPSSPMPTPSSGPTATTPPPSGGRTWSDAADGFASTEGGTTGGAAGATVTVTTQAELEKYAAATEPYVIRVAGTITVQPFGKNITVNSNKTIIGAGTSGEIVQGELHLISVHNVIIRNLTIRDSYVDGDPDGKCCDIDGVQVDSSDHIWIDHNTFSHLNDGLIDSRKDTTDITVSWNVLSDHNKAFGIGWTNNVTARMTIHHNWIHDTNQRNPSTDNVAYAHLYNNYLQNITSYGNYSRGATRMVLENSYFDHVKNPYYPDSTAQLRQSGSICVSCTGKRQTNGSAFDPSRFYSYTLDPASSLPSLLATYAGPQANLGGGGPGATSGPGASGVYQIASGASGKCIEVPGGSTSSGTKLVQIACSGAPEQQWQLVANSGRYNLVNKASGMCLDVTGGSTSSGTQLQQWGCGSAQSNQLWSISASGVAAGKYLVTSASSGMCVSDKDGATAGNNPIVQETCSDVARMRWRFDLLGGSPSGGSATTTTVAADGSGKYRTVQAAIDAVPANSTTRSVITIKPGTYREVITVPSNKPRITLRGTGSSPSNVLLVYNNSAGTHGTFGSASMFVYGSDFIAENLTISNDFDESSTSSGHQALALHLNADRAILRNVRLLGDQDTFLVNNNTRAYVVDSYVEGTVDFIFGGGTIVFDRCSIYEKRSSGGPITAASTPADRTYGFLFYRSTITGAATNVTQLGRPWRADAQVLYRESTLTATIRTAQPWTDMSGNTWQNARYYEYRNTGAGATTSSNRPQMSDAMAANYTPQKYLAGTDGWNPL